jgi:hypothetical protein
MKVEMWLVGQLDADVRQNMLVDVRAACTHNVMATIITSSPSSYGDRVLLMSRWHVILRSLSWAAREAHNQKCFAFHKEH